MSKTLIYFRSEYIVKYTTKNAINWMEDKKDVARLGGMADKLGMPPTPAVEEFLNLLTSEKRLFSQREYTDYCLSVPSWDQWLGDNRARISKDEARGAISCKLYRNFYPAMIDSLHVWAMLNESGLFDGCSLDSYEDAINKVDMSAITNGRHVPIALQGPTVKAAGAKKYKDRYRSNGVDNKNVVNIQMSIRRPRSPGNKRWFKENDVISPILCYGLRNLRYDEATFRHGLNIARSKGICPICNSAKSRRVTCGSCRCTSVWTIGHIPKQNYEVALAEMIEQNFRERIER